MKEKILAVVGPTASGKTALGIRLAKEFQGEIVSCDSMQIYEGLSIGTAKPTPEELSAVPHHLVGICPLDREFSVSDYVILAEQAVTSVWSRGKLPILVGGTGLYARSFLWGIEFEEQGRKEEIRKKLWRQAEEEGILPLYERLKRLDPKAAEKIHPHNEKRVLRALEFYEATGMLFSAQEERSRARPPKYRFSMLCLFYRDRQKLYDRIDRRVDLMLEQGLLEEAEAFYHVVMKSAKKTTAAQAIGYKELFPYFSGEISLEEAVESLKRETRRYAKRQLTWFSREKGALFLYVDEWENEEALFEEAVSLLASENFWEREAAGAGEQ